MRKMEYSAPWLTRRQLLAVLGAGAAAAVGFPLYAFGIEPHWVELVRRPMRMPGLPASLEGATLLQVSDLHVGPGVSSDYLMGALDHARRLEPDLVVVTGDFVTWRGAELPELGRVLARLPRGRRGTFGVLGNHDYGEGWAQLAVADDVSRVAGDAGVRVLRNEVLDVDGLQLCGTGDLWSPEFRDAGEVRVFDPMRDDFRRRSDGATPATGAGDALARLDPARPSLVLCHNPDALDLPLWERVRGWVLGGHTHGGQVKPPFLPPPIIPVRNARYVRGEVDLGGGRTLYVSRGLGHLTRVRFNVRPEVTLFTLTGRGG